MQNIKFVSIFAACGFVFSFLCGLLSKSKFYIILIRALIFGVVFGLLALLISFLYNKFLKDDSSDLSEGAGVDSGSAAPAGKTETRGNRVDFVVRDEELGKGESENHFVVGENHQMLNSTDISSSNSTSSFENLNAAGNSTASAGNSPSTGGNSASDNASKFVPLKNFETVSNFSGKEASSSDNAAANASGSNSGIIRRENTNANLDDSIDTLPDMGGFSFESSSGKASSDDDVVVGDTGESFGSSISTSFRSNDDNVADVKDASLMAKAISSILSNEDS